MVYTVRMTSLVYCKNMHDAISAKLYYTAFYLFLMMISKRNVQWLLLKACFILNKLMWIWQCFIKLVGVHITAVPKWNVQWVVLTSYCSIKITNHLHYTWTSSPPVPGKWPRKERNCAIVKGQCDNNFDTLVHITWTSLG